MKKVRVLSIREPWLTMILLGHKPVENRKRPLKYRGDLYLHAPMIFDLAGYFWIAKQFPHLLHALGNLRRWLPRYMFTGRVQLDARQEAYLFNGTAGHILGKARMAGCVDNSASPWFTGPWGWLLKDPVRLAEPIKCKGRQGIFFAEIPEAA